MTTEREIMDEVTRLYANRLSSTGNTLVAQFVKKFDLTNPEFWDTPINLRDEKDAQNQNLLQNFNGVRKGIYVAALLQLYVQLKMAEDYTVTIGGKSYKLSDQDDPEYTKLCDDFIGKQPKTLGGFLEGAAYSLGEAPIKKATSGASSNKTMLYVGIGGAVAVAAIIGVMVAKKSK